MTIKEAHYRHPYTISMKTDIVPQIRSSLKEAVIKVIKPGRYDLTPQEWIDPNYAYKVTVKDDGTGILKLEPKYAGSMALDSKTGIPAAHELLKPLDEHSEIVVIAGGYKQSPTGIACFRLVWWEPGAKVK